MARLTQAERRLLTHRPTETTWACSAKAPLGDGTAKCGVVNRGAAERCFICGAKKPSRPTLLWPLYVAACKKAGIQPGERWPTATPTETPAKPRGRKKAK